MYILLELHFIFNYRWALIMSQSQTSKCTGGLLLVLILVVFAALSSEAAKELDGNCTTVTNEECPEDYNEIYVETLDEDYVYGSGESTLDVIRRCCTEESGMEKKEKIQAVGCQITSCFDSSTAEMGENGICSRLKHRWVEGKKMQYEEAVRDTCAIKSKKGEVGTEALCCPKNSKEGKLNMLLGAEKHQFPHYALLRIRKPGSANAIAFCGGTIYNKNYIITASHCLMDEGKMRSVNGSYVQLDVRLKNADDLNRYEIERFVVHPNSTKRSRKAKLLMHDVGLVQVKGEIKFGDYIKALPVARKDFNPFTFGNEAIIMGIGNTDTTVLANMLLKARALLREDGNNVKKNSPSGKSYTFAHADAVLFLGGIQDGVTSPRTGPGDSGGPAVCRGEDGNALLCGMVAKGPDLETCELNLDEHHCRPQTFMEAQHYYDWFVSVAGNQSEDETLLRQPLFGAPVPDGRYENQVQVTTRGGRSCGGTLIESDLVITAAHCVVDDRGHMKKDLAVWTGVRAVGGQGQKHSVKSVTTMAGFRRAVDGPRLRRVAKLNVKPGPQNHFYENDLALIKLSSLASIIPEKLPGIGPAPRSSIESESIAWTTEVSLPNSAKKSKVLQQRYFQIFEDDECQNRLQRWELAGYDVQIEERNILCGEEKYNGGAQCDRELGGGLFCKGSDGKEVLCGVQVFRFCQLALPSIFLDVSRHKDWINGVKSELQ